MTTITGVTVDSGMTTVAGMTAITATIMIIQFLAGMDPRLRGDDHRCRDDC
ncbi:MAG: hypothetical protein WC776_03015 [Patescibacteria group bacterium]|jgi:hypothetical protein